MSTKAEQQFTARLRTVVDRAGGAAVIAQIINVTSSAVYGWLAGSRPYPRTVSKLCAKLGISEAWLVEGTGTDDARAELTSRMNEEKPAATKDEGQLTHDLTEMIRSFPSLPAAFEPFALAAIDDHYTEFRRRAHIRADARSKMHKEKNK